MFENWVERSNRFRDDAHELLSKHESSKSRVMNFKKTYENLNSLSIKQEDLIKQSLTCLEKECYRASHVMAWSAFIDFIEEKICNDGCKTIQKFRPRWRIKSVEDLRDIGSDLQIIEAFKECGFCSKTEMKGYRSLLDRRNECAHPNDYYPDLNMTLGYISEILQRIKKLSLRPVV